MTFRIDTAHVSARLAWLGLPARCWWAMGVAVEAVRKRRAA